MDSSELLKLLHSPEQAPTDPSQAANTDPFASLGINMPHYQKVAAAPAATPTTTPQPTTPFQGRPLVTPVEQQRMAAAAAPETHMTALKPGAVREPYLWEEQYNTAKDRLKSVQNWMAEPSSYAPKNSKGEPCYILIQPDKSKVGADWEPAPSWYKVGDPYKAATDKSPYWGAYLVPTTDPVVKAGGAWNALNPYSKGFQMVYKALSVLNLVRGVSTMIGNTYQPEPEPLPVRAPETPEQAQIRQQLANGELTLKTPELAGQQLTDAEQRAAGMKEYLNARRLLGMADETPNLALGNMTDAQIKQLMWTAGYQMDNADADALIRELRARPDVLLNPHTNGLEGNAVLSGPYGTPVEGGGDYAIMSRAQLNTANYAFKAGLSGVEIGPFTQQLMTMTDAITEQVSPSVPFVQRLTEQATSGTIRNLALTVLPLFRGKLTQAKADAVEDKAGAKIESVVKIVSLVAQPGFTIPGQNSTIQETQPLYLGTDNKIAGPLNTINASINSTTLGDVATIRHGIFLTDSPTFAKEYGQNVLQFNANIDPTRIAQLDPLKIATQSDPVINGFIDSLKNWKTEDERATLIAAQNTREPWQFFENDLGARFTSYLQQQGYQAAQFQETTGNIDGNNPQITGKTTVALDPSVISPDASNNNIDIYHFGKQPSLTEISPDHMGTGYTGQAVNAPVLTNANRSFWVTADTAVDPVLRQGHLYKATVSKDDLAVVKPGEPIDVRALLEQGKKGVIVSADTADPWTNGQVQMFRAVPATYLGKSADAPSGLPLSEYTGATAETFVDVPQPSTMTKYQLIVFIKKGKYGIFSVYVSPGENATDEEKAAVLASNKTKAEQFHQQTGKDILDTAYGGHELSFIVRLDQVDDYARAYHQQSYVTADNGHFKVIDILSGREIMEGDDVGFDDAFTDFYTELPALNGQTVRMSMDLHDVAGGEMTEAEYAAKQAEVNKALADADELTDKLSDVVHDVGKITVSQAAIRSLLTPGDPSKVHSILNTRDKLKGLLIGFGITPSAVRKDLLSVGWKSLIGAQAGDAYQMADLAQMVRDPRYEHGWVIITDINGEVIAVNHVSMGVPGFTQLFVNVRTSEGIKTINDYCAAHNGAKVYLIHNHPSGDPTMSSADDSVYLYIMRGLNVGCVGIVVDHDKAVISTMADPFDASKGLAKRTVTSLHTTPNTIHDALLPNSTLGYAISTPEDAATAAGVIMRDPDMAVLFYKNSGGYIRAVELIPTASIKDDAAFHKHVANGTREYGARSVLAVVDAKEIENGAWMNGPFWNLVQEGYLQDVVSSTINPSGIDNESLFRNMQRVHVDIALDAENVWQSKNQWYGEPIHVDASLISRDGSLVGTSSPAILEEPAWEKKAAYSVMLTEGDQDVQNRLKDAIASRRLMLGLDGTLRPKNWFPSDVTRPERTETVHGGVEYSVKGGTLFAPSTETLATANGITGLKVDFLKGLGAKDYLKKTHDFCVGQYDEGDAKRIYSRLKHLLDAGSPYFFLFGGDPVATAATNPAFQASVAKATGVLDEAGIKAPKASVDRVIASLMLDEKAAIENAHKIYAVMRIGSIGMGSIADTKHPVYSILMNADTVKVFKEPISMNFVKAAYMQRAQILPESASEAERAQRMRSQAGNSYEFMVAGKTSWNIEQDAGFKRLIHQLETFPTYRQEAPTPDTLREENAQYATPPAEVLQWEQERKDKIDRALTLQSAPDLREFGRDNIEQEVNGKQPWEMTFEEYLKTYAVIPQMPKVPEHGQWAAIMTDDGSIFTGSQYDEHITIAHKLKIPFARMVGGGMVRDGVYWDLGQVSIEAMSQRALARERLRYKQLVRKARDQGLTIAHDPIMNGYNDIDLAKAAVYEAPVPYGLQEPWQMTKEQFESGVLVNPSEESKARYEHYSIREDLWGPTDVWYHGTQADFTEFKNSGIARGTADITARLGIHFASVQRTAEQFANGLYGKKNVPGRVIEARLAIRNPKAYLLERELRNDMAQYAIDAGIIDPSAVRDAYYPDKNGVMHVGDGGFILSKIKGPVRIKLVNGFRKQLISQGYDGITYHNEIESEGFGVPCAIVFDAGQIQQVVGRKAHIQYVVEALGQGKPVPQNVLDEYPGILPVAPEGYTILYHQTTTDNLKKILKEGLRSDLVGKQTGAKTGQIWSTRWPSREVMYGGNLVAFRIPTSDFEYNKTHAAAGAFNSDHVKDEVVVLHNIPAEDILLVYRGMEAEPLPGVKIYTREDLYAQMSPEQKARFTGAKFVQEEQVPYGGDITKPLREAPIGDAVTIATPAVKLISNHANELRRLQGLERQVDNAYGMINAVKVNEEEFSKIITSLSLGPVDVNTLIEAYRNVSKTSANTETVWNMVNKVYKAASVRAVKDMMIEQQVNELTKEQKEQAKAIARLQAEKAAKYIIEQNREAVHNAYMQFMDQLGVPASIFRTPESVIHAYERIKGEKSLAKAEAYVQRKIGAAQRAELVSSIQDKVSRIRSSKSIAVDYKEQALALADEIEWAGHTDKFIDRIQKMADAVEQQRADGEDPDLNTKHLHQLEILSRKPVSAMTMDELQSLSDALDDLAGWGAFKQQLRNDTFKLEVSNLIDEMAPTVRAQDEAARREVDSAAYIETGKGNAGGLLDARDAIKRLWLGDKPAWMLFKILGVPQLKDRMDTAFDNYLNLRDNWRKSLREIAERNHLTPRHMRRIGTVMHSVDVDGQGVLNEWGVTEAQLQEIIDTMTDGEREYMVAARNLLDAIYPKLDRSMQQEFNVRVGHTDGYFPRMKDFDVVDNLEVKDRFGQLYDLNTGKPLMNEVGAGQRKNVEIGETQNRLAKKNRAELNAARVMERYIDDVAYQISMTHEIRVAKTAIDQAPIKQGLGAIGYTAVSEYYAMMARKGGTIGGRIIPALDWMRKNVASFQILWKLTSAVVQWTQYSDTLAMVGPYWGTVGFTDFASSKEWRQFCISNSPKIRDIVGDDPSYLDLNEHWWSKAGGFALENFDKGTRIASYIAAYKQYCDANGLEADPTNPIQEACDYAQETVGKILASPFTEDMPLVLSTGYGIGNKSFARMILEFQNPMLFRAANIEDQIIGGYGGDGGVPDSGGKSKGSGGLKGGLLNPTNPASASGIRGGNYRGAIWTFLMMVLFSAMVEAAVRRQSKKLLGGTNKDTYAKDTLEQIVGTIPYFGQFYSALQYGNNPVPLIAMIGDGFTYASRFNAAKTASGKIKAGIYLVGTAAGLAGLAPGGSQVLQIMRYNFLDSKTKNLWANTPVSNVPGTELPTIGSSNGREPGPSSSGSSNGKEAGPSSPGSSNGKEPGQ